MALLQALDVSLWGFFRFHGSDAKKFLQGLVTADLGTIKPGQMLPACVLTPKGMLVADCELYEETPETILAVTRPSAAVGFITAFEKKIMLSNSTFKVLRSQTAWLIIGEGFNRGFPWMRLRTPAHLLLGVDPPEDAHLMTATEFESVRIASGFPWYGVDMDVETLPLEVGQEAAISLTKGCYMGQETVSRIVHRGHVNRLLRSLVFPAGVQAPPAGTLVFDGAMEIGHVTSSADSFALAMLKREAAAEERVVQCGGLSAQIKRVA